MAENYMPNPYERQSGVTTPEMPIAIENDVVVDLEEYRKQRARRNILHRMGDAALELSGEGTLSCVPIDISEYSDGDISIRFTTYNAGFRRDDNSVPHSDGWSGGPESKRIIATLYKSTPDEIDAAILHPRNLRYVQSDIRAKERTGEYVQQMQQLWEDMQNR